MAQQCFVLMHQTQGSLSFHFDGSSSTETQHQGFGVLQVADGTGAFPLKHNPDGLHLQQSHNMCDSK